MINYMAPDSRCACNRGDDPVLRRPERKARKSEVRRGGELFRLDEALVTQRMVIPLKWPLSPLARPLPRLFSSGSGCVL